MPDGRLLGSFQKSPRPRVAEKGIPGAGIDYGPRQHQLIHCRYILRHSHLVNGARGEAELLLTNTKLLTISQR